MMAPMDRIRTSDGIELAVHRFEPAEPSGLAEGLPVVVLQHGFAADTETNWVRPGVVAALAELGGVDRRTLDRDALAVALRAADPSTITHPGAKVFRRFAESTGADLLALAAQAERVHRSPIALGSIRVPTRLVVGDADPLATRPEVLVAAISGAELVVVPGDHLGAVGAPEFAPAIVEFLAH